MLCLQKTAQLPPADFAGQHPTIMERVAAALVLAALLHGFRWGVVEPHSVEPEAMIVLRAAGGMPVVCWEREAPAADDG